MILIKANPELKNVYMKLIKTMKIPVTWNEVFVVKNNMLILTGDVRSLIFNFDNKKLYTSILELPDRSAQLESLPSDSLLKNVMNITLYAFGKWGSVSGLKVDKDYKTLNAMFSQVLRQVGIEAEYTEKNFRFYKDGIQVTYEDMMMAVLRLLSSEGKLNDRQSLVTSDSTVKNEANSDKKPLSDEDDKKDKSKSGFENDYEIGLWHNLSWKKDTFDFKKAPKSEEDAAKSRIGNDFYITPYLCPKCAEKLYVGVYPTGGELLIDTEEGRVFMARAYACHNCNTFYTPRPEKLLQEGDVYIVKFDDDRTAYEDYLDILGSRTQRTSNPNFNEFESTRNSKAAKKPDSGSGVAADGNIKSTDSRIKAVDGGIKSTDNDTESANNNIQAAHTLNRTGLDSENSDSGESLTENRDVSDGNSSTVESAKKTSSAAKVAQPLPKLTYIPTEQLMDKTTEELRDIFSV